ncbi:MAG: M48 family peptidase, partial [Burkholderiaceae bacterium]
MKVLRVAPVIALLSLAACETVQTTQPGAVGVTRQQQVSSVVSAKEIEAAADKQYDEMMAEAQKKGLLNRNQQQVARVRTIAQRLIPQTRVFRQDAPG